MTWASGNVVELEDGDVDVRAATGDLGVDELAVEHGRA
jgi:hypothetical protein